MKNNGIEYFSNDVSQQSTHDVDYSNSEVAVEMDTSTVEDFRAPAMYEQENEISGGNLDISDEFEKKLSRVINNNVPEDHSARFEKVLTLLNNMRSRIISDRISLSESSVMQLKLILTDVNIESDSIGLTKLILKNEQLSEAVKLTLQNQVETEIELLSLKETKAFSMAFPIDVNSNIYCDIIEEAAEKTPQLLDFLVNITDSETEKLTPNFIIRTANLIVDILSCKDKRHSALQKINALHLMFQKYMVSNLKTFGQKGLCSGYTDYQTCRRNVRAIRLL